MIPLILASTIPGAMIELSKYGSVCDGATDNSAALTSAFAEAAASHSGSSTVHITKGDCLVNASVSGTGSVAFDPGAELDVTNGHTVSISGAVLADPSQYLFPGAGKVTLTGTAKVYTRWWGAGQGGDLGVPLNAADQATANSTSNWLNTQVATIYENSGGGNFATSGFVSSFHTLELGEGTYTATTNTTYPSYVNYCDYFGAYICLSSNSTLHGRGGATILEESSGYGPGEVQADGGELYGTAFQVVYVDPDLGLNTVYQSSSNVEISSLTIQGLPLNGPYGEQVALIQAQAIAHFNVHDVTMINGRSFGVYAGGSGDLQGYWAPNTTYSAGATVQNWTGQGLNGWVYKAEAGCTSVSGSLFYQAPLGNINWPTVQGQCAVEPEGGCSWCADGIPHAWDVKIEHNSFNGIFAQNAGVVNAMSFSVSRNTFVAEHPLANNSVPAAIDCELNGNADKLNYFHVDDNIIDLRWGYSKTSGHADVAISLNANDATNIYSYGGGTVNGNEITGQDYGAGNGTPLDASAYVGTEPPIPIASGISLQGISNTDVSGNHINGVFSTPIIITGFSIPAGSAAFNTLRNNTISAPLSADNCITFNGGSYEIVEGNYCYGQQAGISFNSDADNDPCPGNVAIGNVQNLSVSSAAIVPPVYSTCPGSLPTMVGNISNGVVWNQNAPATSARTLVLGDGGTVYYDAQVGDKIIETDPGGGSVIVGLPSAGDFCAAFTALYPLGYFPDAGQTTARELTLKTASRASGRTFVQPQFGQNLGGLAIDASAVLDAGAYLNLYGNCATTWEQH